MAGGCLNNTNTMSGCQFFCGSAHSPRKNCVGVPDLLGCKISCDTGSDRDTAAFQDIWNSLEE